MISTTTKYAVQAIRKLATAPDSIYIGINILIKDIDVPRPYLAKILRRLAAKGLILSKKGVKGGFLLPKTKARFTLYDYFILKLKLQPEIC